MIKTISIKNVATFNNEGVKISDLKKVNFIYGANGSGKTTISNFIQEPNNPVFNDCSIEWENDIQYKALVYNKLFRDKNFGKGSLDGVFTLGQATKEDIEKIEQKKEELNKLEERIIKKKQTIETQHNKKEEKIEEFRELVWTTIYKKYENNFKEAFKGNINSKENFKNKLLEEYQKEQPENVSDIEELLKRAETLFGTAPSLLNQLPVVDFNDINTIESNAIWNKKIIGKADVEIAKLIQKLNINDWVNEGINYLEEGSDICPFCQQRTITNDFRQQLEEYFDETFNNDIDLIKRLGDEYNQLTENLVNELNQIEINEKNNDNSKLNIDLFSSRLKTLLNQFNSNNNLISNKLKEPSRSIDLSNTESQLLQIIDLINTANNEVITHNNIVNNYQAERTKLIQDIWHYIVAENKTTIAKYVRKINGLQRGIVSLTNQLDNLKRQYAELNNEIKEANKNITSIQPTVDAINDTLNAYGFQNFKIVPSPTNSNQYQIQREDGSIAETTLSEGEITFITFLYFLQLVKGSKSAENILEDKVIVIDDPISSLDSSVLFVVSSLIKEIIKNIKVNRGNIKQIIILTHNVYFHKEVSFIDGRTKENNDAYFWILRKNKNISTIQCYEMKNPIQNSYELLWQELKNIENTKSSLTIQNIMRRIIENYFKILGKYGDDDLINKFDNPQEKEICRSLISWVNDGSHSIPDDLFIEQQESVIDKYFDVFKRIFKEMEQIEHYNMMMK